MHMFWWGQRGGYRVKELMSRTDKPCAYVKELHLTPLHISHNAFQGKPLDNFELETWIPAEAIISYVNLASKFASLGLPFLEGSLDQSIPLSSSYSFPLSKFITVFPNTYDRMIRRFDWNQKSKTFRAISSGFSSCEPLPLSTKALQATKTQYPGLLLHNWAALL